MESPSNLRADCLPDLVQKGGVGGARPHASFIPFGPDVLDGFGVGDYPSSKLHSVKAQFSDGTK